MHNEHDNEDRVRRNTDDGLNRQVDGRAEAALADYSLADPMTIENRIIELDEEWDIERSLMLQSTLLAITGLILGLTVNKKWFALSFITTGFLAQHSIQGWCPPLPLFRKLGFRTRKEIDKERFALKAIRGDFRRTIHSPRKAWDSVQ